MELEKHYQISIIIVSIIVAMIGSFITLDINERIDKKSKTYRWYWLILTSISMGISVWLMHFIGMIALTLKVTVSYYLSRTIISIVPAIIASFITFLLLHFSKGKYYPILVASFVMGTGIVLMHYVGMSAMHGNLMITYSTTYVICSILLAIIVSFVAFYIFKISSRKTSVIQKIISSMLLGLAVSSMHYTGMKAAHFDQMSDMHMGSMSSTDNHLYNIILMMAVVIFMVFVLVIVQDRQANLKYKYYDELTSLPNRRYLDRLESQKKSNDYSIYLIDVDNFRWINEAFGFDIGNQCLQEITNRFTSTFKGKDKLFRLEGDKFILLLRNSHYPTNKVIQSIQQQFIDDITIDSYQLHLSCSIGIAHKSNDQTIDQCLKKASVALSYAKKNGKNQSIFYETALDSEDWEREYGLRFNEALKNNEFYLCYQPKYSIHSKTIASVEALIRWNSVDLGFVSPQKFIPVAEKTGFIFELTEWILNQACAQMREWIDQGSQIKKVAVNISAHHFYSNKLTTLIQAMLLKYHLKSSHLELEITETSTMTNTEKSIGTIQELNKLGVAVSLDDFGTGISSLNHLKILPISTLKIDKSFIDDITYSTTSYDLVKSIVSLAKIFQLVVVAEGVETLEQVHLLSELPFDELQGYYISKPLEIDALNLFEQTFSPASLSLSTT